MKTRKIQCFQGFQTIVSRAYIKKILALFGNQQARPYVCVIKVE